MLLLTVMGAAWREVWARSTTFGGNLEESPQGEAMGEHWQFSWGGSTLQRPCTGQQALWEREGELLGGNAPLFPAIRAHSATA